MLLFWFQRKFFPYDYMNINLVKRVYISITGIVKVNGNIQTAVESVNNKVKITNVNSNTLISIVNVYNPFDITCVYVNLLVVSCREVLQFLELKHDILTVVKKRLKFQELCGAVISCRQIVFQFV